MHRRSAITTIYVAVLVATIHFTQARADHVLHLFSVPDYDSSEYENARAGHLEFVANFSLAPSRSEILKRNDDAISELVSQIESSPSELANSFEVSAFGGLLCVIESIERTFPSFSSGDDIPDVYSADASCGESGRRITVSVFKREGRVGFGMRGGRAGGIGVVPIGDSIYSVAYELYPEF